MVDAGANVNEHLWDINYYTPLIIAGKSATSDFTKQKHHKTSEIIKLVHKSMEICKFLLEHGADHRKLDKFDNGWTETFSYSGALKRVLWYFEEGGVVL